VTSEKTHDEKGFAATCTQAEACSPGLPPIRNSYVFFLEVLRGVLIAEPWIKKGDELGNLRSKIAIRCGGRKSCEYLRLEICSVLILLGLRGILIPDLRLEIRVAPVSKALERRLWSP
jgi:hypothetical protein